MNVNQVLEGTLSPDATTRQNAEQQLNQAAEVNFSEYLITLAQELANDQAQPHIRTAAGLALKNAFSSRDFARLREIQQKWVQQVDPAVKKNVKGLALQTLRSSDSRAGQSSGQFIASIASIELPRNEWPELMPSLVENVGSGTDQLKQASLVTIGFICETDDMQLRAALSLYSNSILTAVVQGARKEEPNLEVRNSAVSALSDCLEFVKSNFDNEGERNYIMQVVCEATQSGDTRIEAGAFGCLNRIMALYYDKMKFYMEKALYGLTIIGMKSDEEDVAKLAVEFWCTVCEEELGIEDDNDSTQISGGELRPHYYFARVAAGEVVPTLVELLTKQDEDATEDEYNISKAAYQCLQLFAQCTHGEIAPVVLRFVEQLLPDQDWHKRDAAVSAFGAIMDGPDDKLLENMVKQGLPLVLQKMQDENDHVKDSAAYALGRICEVIPDAIDPQTQLETLLEALFNGIHSSPRMAGSCCWALMNIADNFGGDDNTNSLSPHFQGTVSAVLSVTEKSESNGQLRTAAYEVLNSFVGQAARDSLPIVAKLLDVIIQRLEATIPMQQQVVSIEDKMMLEEMQTSITSCLLAIVQRLGLEIKSQADRIMTILLRVLSTVPKGSSVPEVVFATVGALASSCDEDFVKYMEPFAPFLYNALGNHEEPALCSIAIGLVSDITRSLGDKAQPFCDSFMNYLLNNLRSTSLSNQFKPAILQCFGDIAQAIGVHFETYLSVVAQVLQQAANVSPGPDQVYDLVEYVISLREGIMDAWSGIILAMKDTKAQLLTPYVDTVFQLLSIVYQDGSRSEGLMRSAMGVIGDLSDAFPQGEYSNYFRSEWITLLIKEVRQNTEFTARTRETARWAKEQARRQASLNQFPANSMS